jgi:hypothetical protein
MTRLCFQLPEQYSQKYIITYYCITNRTITPYNIQLAGLPQTYSRKDVNVFTVLPYMKLTETKLAVQACDKLQPSGRPYQLK